MWVPGIPCGALGHEAHQLGQVRARHGSTVLGVLLQHEARAGRGLAHLVRGRGRGSGRGRCRVARRLAHVAHVREDEGEVLEEHGLARVRVRVRAGVRVRVRVRVRVSARATAREG